MTIDMKTPQEIESNFTFADYSVFVVMLLISSVIGIYYAWTVSLDLWFLFLFFILLFLITF